MSAKNQVVYYVPVVRHPRAASHGRTHVGYSQMRRLARSAAHWLLYGHSRTARMRLCGISSTYRCDRPGRLVGELRRNRIREMKAELAVYVLLGLGFSPASAGRDTPIVRRIVSQAWWILRKNPDFIRFS